MMKHHEVCDLVPGMTERQYEVLRDDIRERGLINEIVLYEGAILDGKHRHRACVELGIAPRFRQYEGTDPAGFVFSINIAHRHLEKGQLAMAGAKLKGYFAEKAKARMDQGRPKEGVENFPQDTGKARDQAASKVGVSGKSVDMAEVIIKKGVPALVKMVEAGEISLHSGHTIASLSKSRQETVVAMPTRKARNAAISKSVTASTAKTRSAKTDHVPGTQLVRSLLSRLENIANEIENIGLSPESYARSFIDQFDWSEPLLVSRLSRAQSAIEAISTLSMIGLQAKRKAA